MNQTRLFLGTFLGVEDQERLRHVQESNVDLTLQWNCRMRWSQPAKLHLTWLFLGNLDESRKDDLLAAIGQAVASCAKDNVVVYDRLEVWFGKNLPRHLVITPSCLPKEFAAVVANLRHELLPFVEANLRSQAREEYKPHLTLSRLQPLNGAEPQLPAENSPPIHLFADKASLHIKELAPATLLGMDKVMPLGHKIDHLALIASKQAAGSNTYSIEKSFPLA